MSRKEADDALGENRALRQQLENLLAQARRNDDIMRRHHQLDLAFMGAEGFGELIDHGIDALLESSELDVVSIALLDPDYRIRRMLIDLGIHLSDYPHLLFLESGQDFGALEHALDQPVLGRHDEERFGRLFPEPMVAPASVAIVPLRRKGVLTGSLNLGSFHADRFLPGMATDFLQHRAAVMAICLENAFHREMLRHIGLTDTLTRVHNRRYLEQRLEEEMGRACRSGEPLACMFIDIDHFKQINDSVGHQAGDDVLREVAGRIKAELRLADALGRFGGEEFLVLLPDTGQDDAIRVAERIRQAIADPVRRAAGEPLTVTVSIGIATLQRQTKTLDAASLAGQLVNAADAAVYEAKESGRNRVVALRL